MDIVSEKILKSFANDRGLASLEESAQFEHLGCFISVSPHCSETFDTSDTHMGVAEGIDGFAAIVNGRLILDLEELTEIEGDTWDVSFIFVQADRGPNFDSAKMGDFGYAVSDFFKATPKLPQASEIKNSAQIKNAIYDQSKRFKKGNPLLRLYYVTTGTWNNELSPRAKKEACEANLVETVLFRDVQFVPIGAVELQKTYHQITSAVEREFILHDKITLPQVPGVSQAYLGCLPLPELVKIIRDDAGANIISNLFQSNPRDWQDWNSVNREMKETLESDARKRFVLMNNGITIIAKEIRPTGDKFVIDDYEVVNGCQTCHVLLECADLSDATISVPIRLIGTKDEAIKNAIIRATNRQTQVSADQFFALQDFPKELEKYFSSFSNNTHLYYERRSKQYDRQAVDKTRIVTQSNLIKAFAAMFHGAAHKTTRNYSAIRETVGTEIFGKDHKMEPYYTAAYALYRLEGVFRGKKLDAKFKPARFHILLAMRIIGNPSDVPQLASNKIVAYCKPINDLLWDSANALSLVLKSAEIIEKAVEGNFHRDNIRTEPTTQKVIDQCVRLGQAPS